MMTPLAMPSSRVAPRSPSSTASTIALDAEARCACGGSANSGPRGSGRSRARRPRRARRRSGRSASASCSTARVEVEGLEVGAEDRPLPGRIGACASSSGVTTGSFTRCLCARSQGSRAAASRRGGSAGRSWGARGSAPRSRAEAPRSGRPWGKDSLVPAGRHGATHLRRGRSPQASRSVPGPARPARRGSPGASRGAGG